MCLLLVLEQHERSIWNGHGTAQNPLPPAKGNGSYFWTFSTCMTTSGWAIGVGISFVAMISLWQAWPLRPFRAWELCGTRGQVVSPEMRWSQWQQKAAGPTAKGDGDGSIPLTPEKDRTPWIEQILSDRKWSDLNRFESYPNHGDAMISSLQLPSWVGCNSATCGFAPGSCWS